MIILSPGWKRAAAIAGSALFIAAFPVVRTIVVLEQRTENGTVLSDALRQAEDTALAEALRQAATQINAAAPVEIAPAIFSDQTVDGPRSLTYRYRVATDQARDIVLQSAEQAKTLQTHHYCLSPSMASNQKKMSS